MFKWLKNVLNPEDNEKKDDIIDEVFEDEDIISTEESEIISEEIEIIEDFTQDEIIEEVIDVEEIVEDITYDEDTYEDDKYIEIVEEVSVDATYDGEVIDDFTQEDVIIEESEEEIIEEETNNDGFFGFFKKVFTGLEKTRNNFTDKINEVLGTYLTIDEELYEDLEDILITADVGVDTTISLINNLRERIKNEKITDPNSVIPLLADEAKKMITLEESKKTFDPKKEPTIVLVVGVNGVGKTTTIGKLAYKYKTQGKKVLLVAADTFRAAATEQLQEWAKRANVDIVHHSEGSDPAAVVFDAIQAAKARDIDIVLCDTAGRLHNKANLMNELEKMYRIIDKNFPEANKESLIVLDATTGQNALLQAREFKEVANVTGIVITKLDGTAKGGIVLPLIHELQIPVVYIGVGEKIDDLQPFDSNSFINSIFGIEIDENLS
ncbi:MAG: signal recognition particle-docking protein FtsY [Tissierellia bacterium]|nr:signal recognition particle-docking protein FtsY [Tissierellia bacterium]